MNFVTNTVEIIKIEEKHKEEIKSIQKEHNVYKKEQEIRYKTMKEEKDNILEEMVKIQTEKDLLLENNTLLENKVCIKKKLNIIKTMKHLIMWMNV